jgi:hypothetical protein
MRIPDPEPIDPATAATRLVDLGFLSVSDLPDRPGPAFLLVAIRPVPTLHHFDPELVEYWVTKDGRGQAASITGETPMPLQRDFSWGLIRIVDRLGVTNEYLTFGGRLEAARVGADTVIVFTSPAPLLRRGGHSQGWDIAAVDLGAFFGRMMVAVDHVPGFEARVAAAAPTVRYAAFVADVLERFRGSPELRAARADLWSTLRAESGRLRNESPDTWTDALALREAARLAA